MPNTIYPSKVTFEYEALAPKCHKLVRIKFVAARLLFQVEQVCCWKDRETPAMHVALCHCEMQLTEIRSTFLNLFNLQSHIMNHVFYGSHTGYTIKGAMLSCCTTVQWCTRQGGFHLAGCRVHWRWANRFCTTKSFQSLLAAYNVSASDPVVLWDSDAAELCGSSCGLENCLVEASRSTKNCPIQILTSVFSHIMSFHGFSWFVSNWFVHGRSFPVDHAWKVV